MTHLLLAVIYLAFISLGLPDALLGSAWPHIYEGFGVSVSASGIVFMLISLGTVASSLASDRLTRRLGAGRVTFFSVLLTALALFGFSFSTSFPMLCLLAVPYGLGAGSVDAALNNYVALHYASRHMSWLHCMWGVGAATGPYVMSLALTHFHDWHMGYRLVGMLQCALVLVLLLSLPLWKKAEPQDVSVTASAENASSGERASSVEISSSGKRAPSGANRADNGGAPLTFTQTIRLRGALSAMLVFLCYCAIEQTIGLWASSYLVLVRGIDAETATACAAYFFIGITAGRALSGFLTLRFHDKQMVRLGLTVLLAGILLILLPLPDTAALSGLIIAGLGCAPVYPSMIHATPARFGEAHSQAVIGVQMASAYIGTSFMPPLFGLLASVLGIGFFPVYLMALFLLLAFMHEKAASL